jgi:signal transduction histidine kinase
MRDWLARVRKSRLSTRVAVLFAAAFVLPWCAYAWLTITERAEQVERTERYLAALATAYAQHATTTLQLGAHARGGETVSNPGRPPWTTQLEDELTAFRAGLNVPRVTFSLRWVETSSVHPGSGSGFTTAFDDHDDMIVAEVSRAGGGIGATASMRKNEALKDWLAGAYTQAIALFIRSLFVVGVGWFLVRQLRWREAHEGELVRAKEKAEAASRAKSEFLANMSHELRTPLNAIIGFADIIKTRLFGPTSERYPEYAGDIANSANHLLSLINDILNLAKLEAGKFQLQEQEVDLAVTVDECLRLLETQVRKGNIRLSVALDPEAVLLYADARRLRQILLNLLSNAVKFTPEGGDIRVTSVRRNGGVAISVSDTGCGIAAADIPKVLAPFGQVESKIRRRHEGTGLGLPLAKQLVELHGGLMTIDSNLDVGTTVTILLPATRVIAAPPRLAVTRAAG